MRENRVNLTRYGISRFAYQELKAFCRQYPEKKAMAEACIMPGASERIGSGGGLPGDPVSRAAAARELAELLPCPCVLAALQKGEILCSF